MTNCCKDVEGDQGCQDFLPRVSLSRVTLHVLISLIILLLLLVLPMSVNLYILDPFWSNSISLAALYKCTCC